MDPKGSHKSALGSRVRSEYATGAVLLMLFLAIGLAVPAYGATSYDCPLIARANRLVGGTGPALSSLRAASAHGNRTAQVLVSLYYGYRYQNLGRMIPQSKVQEILHWIHTAARGGNPLSVYVYGAELISIGKARANPALIRHGKHLIRVSIPRLIKGTHAPCAALYQFALATAYNQGVVAPKNLRQSFLWARRSAHRGSSMGAALLGQYYIFWQQWIYRYNQTWNTPFSCEKGMRWLRTSLGEGNPSAGVTLGKLYMAHGCGAHSPRKGVALFRMAAEHHVPVAYYYLGLCYDSGIGVQRNPLKGFLRLVRAALDGVKGAASSTATFTVFVPFVIESAYRTGHGLGAARQDMRALKTAAREGFKPAEQALKRLRSCARRSNEPV